MRRLARQLLFPECYLPGPGVLLDTGDPVTKILVLDDDHDWFTRCEEALSSKGSGGLGFEMRLVPGASCGRIAGALADIWDRVPDVVFLGMESGEGQEVLWLLGDIMPGVPVVICSSEGDLSATSSGPAVAGQAAAFLHKFAGHDEIVGTTMRVLGGTFPMGGGAGLLDCGEGFDSMVH